MPARAEDSYSLPACLLIAAAPFAIALFIVYFAEPRGVVLFEVRPLGWLVDYLVIWPVVWFSTRILTAAKWIWYDPERGIDVRSSLRLTGGFSLIYVCIWLCVVPVIHEASVRYPFLPIDRPSYSQLFRFLFGVGGAIGLLVLRTVLQARSAGREEH